MDTGDEFITLARAEFRADLADMRNDLKDFIREELKGKADTSRVEALSETLSPVVEWSLRAQRGEFTEAQKGTVERWITKVLLERAASAWKGWEKKLAVTAALVGALGLCTSMVVAVHVLTG